MSNNLLHRNFLMRKVYKWCHSRQMASCWGWMPKNIWQKPSDVTKTFAEPTGAIKALDLAIPWKESQTGWRLKCRAFVFSTDSSDSSSIPNGLHWLPITTALILRLAERIRIQVLGCASQEYKVVHNFSMSKPSDIPTSPLLSCLLYLCLFSKWVMEYLMVIKHA